MKRVTEYLKIRVLAAIDFAIGSSIRDRIKQVSKMVFTDEEGNTRTFTWRTIETWHGRYKKNGIEALQSHPRSDKGKPRKVPLEQIQLAVDEVLPLFHAKTPSKAALYRMCLDKDLLSRQTIAPNTFSRVLKEHGMLKSDQEQKRRLSFSKAYANEMWQGDTMFGPHAMVDGAMKQTKLIAFIDDASRVCIHGEFFASETVDQLVEVFKSAFYKRGVPKSIYVDNGSIYISQEIVNISARIGCLHHHAPVRDGAAKGKVERFFRTVREQFLILKLDLSSLEVLNKQFTHWVEESYNAHKHSVLGMTPLERFSLDSKRIRYLPPNEVTDELFFAEVTRVVRAANTFSFKSKQYETPRHLANLKIQVRYQRSNPHNKVIVFYKGDRMGEARPLDPIANDKKPRTSRNIKDKNKGEK